MNNLQRLATMGCGKEILNSVIDRSNISAAIYNANVFYQYYKKSVASGLHTKEQAINGIMNYYNSLKSVEHLVNVYHELYKDQYCKLKLKIEKLIN